MRIRHGTSRGRVSNGTSLLVTVWRKSRRKAWANRCRPPGFQKGRNRMGVEPAFLFDLDGTLVDSVYQHVLAWKEALDAEGIELSVWRIHRNIGMSGGLFTNQLLRETGIEISAERVERLRHAHAAAYRQQANHIRPLPGARELLNWLSKAGIPCAIATSGPLETAAVNLASIRIGSQS